MTMAAIAREALEDPNDALDSLSEERPQAVEDRHRDAQRFNVDADVLTAFEFADLLALTRKTGLYRSFGYASATSWHKLSERLVAFRDDVMHPTSEFLRARTIADLIQNESTLRQILLSVPNR
jgi:hypothetical protein